MKTDVRVFSVAFVLFQEFHGLGLTFRSLVYFERVSGAVSGGVRDILRSGAFWSPSTVYRDLSLPIVCAWLLCCSLRTAYVWVCSRALCSVPLTYVCFCANTTQF